VKHAVVAVMGSSDVGANGCRQGRWKAAIVDVGIVLVEIAVVAGGGQSW